MNVRKLVCKKGNNRVGKRKENREYCELCCYEHTLFTNWKHYVVCSEWDKHNEQNLMNYEWRIIFKRPDGWSKVVHLFNNKSAEMISSCPRLLPQTNVLQDKSVNHVKRCVKIFALYNMFPSQHISKSPYNSQMFCWVFIFTFTFRLKLDRILFYRYRRWYIQLNIRVQIGFLCRMLLFLV